MQRAQKNKKEREREKERFKRFCDIADDFMAHSFIANSLFIYLSDFEGSNNNTQ